MWYKRWLVVVAVVALTGMQVASGQDKGGGNFAFYMHTTGYFQAMVPDGGDWEISESDLPDVDQVEAGQYYNLFAISANMNAVVHFMAQPMVSAADAQSVIDEMLTDEFWETSWANYVSWEIAEQRIEDPYVITRFDLVLNDTNFVASDSSWVDSGWMYTVRGVYPVASSGLLDTLEQMVVPGVVPYPEVQTLPPSWPVYVDRTLGYMIKYPATWELLDGNEGEPLSIAGPTNEKDALIRVQVQANTPVAVSTDAKAWLSEHAPTAEIADSAPLKRPIGTGYQLMYKVGTPLNPRSGLAVLLNDDANTLYAADLEVGIGGLDLISGGDLLPDVAQQGQMAITQGFVFLRGIPD